MKFLHANRGQTLIEVLIAFATLAVVITSATMAVISALGNSEFVKNQHLALQYAQQGMEIVRSMREDNYPAFLSLSNPNSLPIPDRTVYYCMAKSCTSLLPTGALCGPVTTACTSQNLDAFVRGVAIDKTLTNQCNGGQATQVVVNVSWIDGQCPRGVYCHTVSVTSCLAPINTISVP